MVRRASLARGRRRGGRQVVRRVVALAREDPAAVGSAQAAALVGVRVRGRGRVRVRVRVKTRTLTLDEEWTRALM